MSETRATIVAFLALITIVAGVLLVATAPQYVPSHPEQYTTTEVTP